MTQNLAVVIESRFLVREALASLMTSQGYQVIGTISSSADITRITDLPAAPALVVLGSMTAEEVSLAASSVKQNCRRAKIVYLYERASPADAMKLLASEIDGCIPLFASKEVFVDACQRILTGDFRVLILKTEAGLSTYAMSSQQADEPSLIKTIPVLVENTEHPAASRRVACGLSDREEDILKGLTRGHSNKMIARICGISEATIKVHMKSILRKTQVTNRTQAAIWALEKGYGAAA